MCSNRSMSEMLQVEDAEPVGVKGFSVSTSCTGSQGSVLLYVLYMPDLPETFVSYLLMIPKVVCRLLRWHILQNELLAKWYHRRAGWREL